MEVILPAALLSETNMLFLCVGGGSDKARIVQLSKDKNLKNLLFWPSQPPAVIVRLYHLAFAGLATFRDSSLLECTRLAASKPVLFSGAGEGADLVTKVQAGIVVPPGDGESLAKAVRDLIKKPDDAAQLGKNGRVYAEKHLQ